jgi:serine/threonine protein phosphatase PrpC
MLRDDQIAALLERPIASAVDALIGASLEHGAPDNVTVVVVQVLAWTERS